MSNREDRPSSNEELKGDTYSTPRIQAFLAMRNLTKKSASRLDNRALSLTLCLGGDYVTNPHLMVLQFFPAKIEPIGRLLNH